MAIERQGERIHLRGVISVEEAEPLCGMLSEEPPPSVDLSACTHLHTAVLRVLLAARVQVAAPPQQAFLRDFILPVLRPGCGGGAAVP